MRCAEKSSARHKKQASSRYSGRVKHGHATRRHSRGALLRRPGGATDGASASSARSSAPLSCTRKKARHIFARAPYRAGSGTCPRLMEDSVCVYIRGPGLINEPRSRTRARTSTVGGEKWARAFSVSLAQAAARPQTRSQPLYHACLPMPVGCSAAVTPNKDHRNLGKSPCFRAECVAGMDFI